ncbi:MAG: diadenylate cyclase [Sphingopyxis sp.]|nr:diadenylate cyclase [Sphingopyxis sp.]
MRAADAFLRAPAILITEQMPDYDLFSILNNISLMRYEHGEGVGRLLLASSSHPKIGYLLKLAEPIALRDARWARKMLEMAEGSLAVIADSRKIYGLGLLSADHNAESEDAFWIDFLGHHQWDFGNGDHILMRTRYGSPLLPQETISEARFTDNMIQQFASCDPERLWSIFQTLLRQERGAMLIIADDAAEEADRLGGQGTRIVPTLAEGELIAAATRIDGSILVDPLGHCHAIGIILDGTASNLGSGARGSRFNSAMRYVAATDQVRVAVVISDDRTVDIHPLLRRKIDRELVERQFVALENASIDDFYEPREFINQNRFYLLPEQCERANAALIRINELPAPVGRIKWTTKPLEPDPEMNEGYFL